MMYGHLMNGTDDHLDALATQTQPQLLGLFAIFTVACTALIIIGTSVGNSDLYDKIGEEMATLWKNTRATFYAIAWAIPATYNRLQAKNLGVKEYEGRHRLATA